MKKKFFIDDEEKEIIESFEKWEFKTVNNLEENKKIIKQIFKNNISKRKSINIRLLESDIQKIKVKAIEEWLPYQTLISQVLHKFSNWKVIFK